LRAQLRLGSEAVQDYQRLLEQKKVMEQSVAELVAAKVTTRFTQTKLARERENDSVSTEKTLTCLRSELEQVRRELNSRTLQVNDALSEADSLSEFHEVRQEQIR